MRYDGPSFVYCLKVGIVRVFRLLLVFCSQLARRHTAIVCLRGPVPERGGEAARAREAWPGEAVFAGYVEAADACDNISFAPSDV